MKRIVAAFTLLVAAAVALPTRASAQEQPFQATVPFTFTVGNRVLPTGIYRIRTLGTSQVQIENVGQNIVASVLANSEIRLRDENKKLVFDKVGAQYFLREIVSTSTAVELPKSASEKKALMLARQSIDASAKAYTTQ